MMPIDRAPRIVLDTNVVLRSLINPQSHSGVLVKACEARRGICVLSKPLMAEYRRVLKHVSEIRPSISADEVNLAWNGCGTWATV